MDYEKYLLNTLSNDILMRLYEKIDEYSSMSEAEQSFHEEAIQELISMKV